MRQAHAPLARSDWETAGSSVGCLRAAAPPPRRAGVGRQGFYKGAAALGAPGAPLRLALRRTTAKLGWRAHPGQPSLTGRS